MRKPPLYIGFVTLHAERGLLLHHFARTRVSKSEKRGKSPEKLHSVFWTVADNNKTLGAERTSSLLNYLGHTSKKFVQVPVILNSLSKRNDPSIFNDCDTACLRRATGLSYAKKWEKSVSPSDWSWRKLWRGNGLLCPTSFFHCSKSCEKKPWFTPVV